MILRLMTAFSIFTLFAIFMFGFIFGLMVESLGSHEIHKANIKLTREVQEQFWYIQGLEQKVKQYEEDACTHVIIDTQYIEVER